MFRFTKLTAMIVVFAFFVSFFTGCGGDSGGGAPKPQTYTVSFILNGGEPPVPSVEVQQGGAVSAPAVTPARAGFDFDGWYRDSATTVKAVFPITVTQNIILYAGWTAYTYTVTFDSNGGSNVHSLQVRHGDAITAPTPPTFMDNFFTGWHVDSELTEKVKFPYTVTQDTTLYAGWMSEEDIVLINTAADLNNVRNNLSGNYRLTANISLGAYFNWAPIGTATDPFTGIINGNGYKITALRTNTTTTPSGLFGYVNGGTITGLTLEGVNIGGRAHAGSVAGYVINGTITDCRSTGNVSIVIRPASSFAYIGGIAGYVQDSTINNCYSTVKVSTDNASIYYSFTASIGGIAGYAMNSIIADSYSTGDVSTSLTTTASVLSTGSVSTYSGGIAGWIMGNSIITNCFSTGDVSAASTASASSPVPIAPHTFTASHSGGIAGHVFNGEISNCYSTGNISANTSNISNDADSAFSYSGGIAGYVINGEISNCYGTGEIFNSFYSAEGNYDYSGGIAGRIDKSNITNCAAINHIIAAKKYAGRIVGDIAYPDVSSISSNNFAFDIMDASGFAQFENITNTSLHGTDKTDVQLKTQTTYSGDINGDGLGGLGWRFGNDANNPWKMPAGGGYPILYWQ